MDKLDRLGWAAGLCVDAYGVKIGVRVNVDDAAIVDEMSALLPPGSVPSSEPSVDVLYSLIVGREPQAGKRYFHLLYMNETRVARTMDWGEVRERLMLGGRVLVAYHARRELFVAAGVVGYRDQAIVIPGLDQDARADLVAALVQAGCTYLSSEYAPIDKEQGLVLPFRNPLPLRHRPDEQARRYPIEAFGGSAEFKALPVGLVAIAEYHPSAQWRQREVSQEEAVRALMDHTAFARSQPQGALQALKRAVSEATTLKVNIGDAHEAAYRLLEHPIWQSMPAVAQEA